MTKKLKLLAAADLHGDSRLAKKLAEKAEKFLIKNLRPNPGNCKNFLLKIEKSI